MKKLFISSLIIFGGSFVWAGIAGNPSGQGKSIEAYVSPAVNKSSETGVISYAQTLSTTSTALACVTVNQAGTSSFFDIYLATTAKWDNGVTLSTANATRIAHIDTTLRGTYWYPGWYPTGIITSNYGAPAADVTIFYLDYR